MRQKIEKEDESEGEESEEEEEDELDEGSESECELRETSIWVHGANWRERSRTSFFCFCPQLVL